MITLSVLTSACSVNPATGDRSFTGLMSPEDEQRIGAEEHPKLVKAFGGLYKDEKLQSYVSSVGELVHATSEMHNNPFTFVILDSPVVNAYALPGGYIHITRGLLALANDEAELAGVLAHEIGHVTARHSAQRHTRGLIASLSTTILGAVLGSRPIAELSNLVGNAYIQGYSRDQEFEADDLGVRYLARAGYDPLAMSTFLESMRLEDDLRKKIINKSSISERPSIFASHPRTSDRVLRSANEASVRNVSARERERTIFLKKLDGLIWGDSPDQGYINGQKFNHPILQIHFLAPPKFNLRNHENSISGGHKNGAFMNFDGDKLPQNNTNLQNYLENEWLSNIRLSDLEKIYINGMEAVTATGLLTIGGGWSNARFVVIRWSKDYVYRFLFVNPVGDPPLMDQQFKESAFSFRRLTSIEAELLRPLRIKIVEVKEGETMTTLSKKMAMKNNKFEWFKVLNGLSSTSQVEVGQLIKLVSY